MKKFIQGGTFFIPPWFIPIPYHTYYVIGRVPIPYHNDMKIGTLGLFPVGPLRKIVQFSVDSELALFGTVFYVGHAELPIKKLKKRFGVGIVFVCICILNTKYKLLSLHLLIDM